MKKNILLYLLSILFFSCGNANTSSSETLKTTFNQRELEKIAPKNTALAEKYSRSCIVCHSNPDAKAPLVSDKASWAKLIENKSMDSLIYNVTNGYKNMPAKGQCADCSKEDYQQLIHFMAGLEN